MPDAFLSSVLQEEQGIQLPSLGAYAVGQLFMPQDETLRNKTRLIIDTTVAELGHEGIAWRVVPTNNRSLGLSARKTEPVIEQIFITASGKLDKLEAEQQVGHDRNGVGSRCNKGSHLIEQMLC